MHLSSIGLEDWVRDLARRDPTPAGGSLALVTLAGAAALAAKAVRLGGGDPGSFESRAARFLEGAEGDAHDYEAARRNGGEAVRRALAAETDRLADALEFVESLESPSEGLPPPVAADLAAAGRLARAAARVLLVNLALNLSAWSERVAGLDGVAADLDTLRARLEVL